MKPEYRPQGIWPRIIYLNIDPKEYGQGFYTWIMAKDFIPQYRPQGIHMAKDFIPELWPRFINLNIDPKEYGQGFYTWI